MRLHLHSASLVVVLGLIGSLGSTPAAYAASAPAAPAAATAALVKASQSFLATLSDEQRQKVQFNFNDNEQRARWSNFPTPVVPRAGLRLKDLTESQRDGVTAILRVVLSDQGYQKVQDIRDADDAFKGMAGAGKGGRRGGPGGGPGGDEKGNGQKGPPSGAKKGGRGGGDGELFGKDLYFISFLGTPSETEPWMLQFGGHHLALNITVVGEKGVLTPSLTATQPATFQRDGQTVRPLGRENDKAFALVNALSEVQRKQAVLNYRVQDLVLGPGHDGQTIQPEGLKGSEMNEQQRAMLLDLISEWATIVADSFASKRMADLKADLDATWFAWSGPTQIETGKNGISYFRIQGPRLVIEYAPQGEADHIHAMYRDPTNDYGAALTKKP